jgi:fused signal recognition particle receptor
MDTNLVIAVVAAAVVLVGLVIFLIRRRAPELPKETERREPDLTAKPAQPPAEAARAREAREVKEARKEKEEVAPPAAPEAAIEAPAEAEEAAPSAAAADHERDVAAIRKGLANTRGGLIARLAKLFGSRPTVDESLLDQIEEVLITSDVGVKTSERILAKLRTQMSSGELTDADSVWKSLRQLAVVVLDVRA